LAAPGSWSACAAPSAPPSPPPVQRPCDRWDLHSFPTRRSSDLADSRAERSPWAEGESAENPVPTSGSRNGVTAPLVTEVSQMPRDRKSTRLNSSHVSLSYAVYCYQQKSQPRGREIAWTAGEHHH